MSSRRQLQQLERRARRHVGVTIADTINGIRIEVVGKHSFGGFVSLNYKQAGQSVSRGQLKAIINA